jgi:hypothetical protein
MCWDSREGESLAIYMVLKVYRYMLRVPTALQSMVCRQELERHRYCAGCMCACAFIPQPLLYTAHIDSSVPAPVMQAE